MNQEIRSLGAIADDINQLARENIFAIGDLLIEAKAQCEHGQWLNWLYSEFDWSTSTAERKMRVADLGGKFVKLTILKLGTTTLYDLADHENEDDLPAVIDELAKHATKTRLSPADARRVIKIGIGRQRFGNRPDATLLQLVELDQYNGEDWHDHAVATLQERSRRPTRAPTRSLTKSSRPKRRSIGTRLRPRSIIFSMALRPTFRHRQ